VDQAAKVGEPTLVDPTPLAANKVSQETMRQVAGLAMGQKSVSVEAVATSGPPAANEAAPRSDAPAPASGDPFARPNTLNVADPNEMKPAGTTDANELKPSGPADPNELKPETTSSASDAPAPPPVQINEIQQGQTAAGASSSSSSDLASDKDISSSKKKKKKGLKKIIPF
jgi:hypothetical protein